MATLNEPNTTNDDIGINNILDHIFTEKENKAESDDISNTIIKDDATLYQLLDELSGTRKLMSCLFGPAQEINLSTKDNKLTSRTLQFGEEWYRQEHIVLDNSSTTRALRSDTPVYFSWSHDSKRKSRPSSPVKAQHYQDEQPEISPSRSTTEIPSKNLLNNQRLLGVVAEQMKSFKKSSYSWGDILNDNGESDPIKTDKETASIDSHPDYKENVSIKKSTFKVNPLAKFVAQELPKPKKHENKSPSKSHHSKSKLWFWGSKNSKKKHNKNKNDKKTVDEVLDDTSKGKGNPVIYESPTNKQDMTNANIEEHHPTNNVLNELFEDDPIGETDNDSTIGYLQSQDNSALELQLTNTNTNNLDILPSETSRTDIINLSNSAEYPGNHDLVTDNVTTINDSEVEKTNMEDSSNDDSDDDFGNFEQAMPNTAPELQILDLSPPPPPPPKTITTTTTTERDFVKPSNILPEFTELQKSGSNNNVNSSSTINLMMNSFVPLQPSKK